MNRLGNRLGNRARFGSHLSSVAAFIAVGCGGHVDLGGSPHTGAPEPVTDARELAAQTTNLVQLDRSQMSSLAIDEEFLYFSSLRGGGDFMNELSRCQKSNCLSTLTVIASQRDTQDSWLGLNANRLGWPHFFEDVFEMCDAPDCKNQRAAAAFKIAIWDASYGYWSDFDDSSIYRCQLSDCSAGKTLLAPFPSGQGLPRNFTLADDRIYWTIEGEGIMRARLDGPTTAERLTLGNVTEWTTARLEGEFSSDVTVLGMALDGPYLYAALRVGNQNAHQTLGCDTCKPGVAVARWPYSAAGSAREWILRSDADVAELVHLRVFGGEVVWGTATGNLWSCVADRCSTSKRQLGIQDASSSFPAPWQFDSVAIDEQSIFWLSVPCQPQTFDCSPDGHRNWTLKRTPRIPQ